MQAHGRNGGDEVTVEVPIHPWTYARRGTHGRRCSVQLHRFVKDAQPTNKGSRRHVDGIAACRTPLAMPSPLLELDLVPHLLPSESNGSLSRKFFGDVGRYLRESTISKRLLDYGVRC